MKVAPYVQPPPPSRVAVIDEQGRYLVETGELVEPDQVPPGTRCFLLWDVARLLLRDGRGEALAWNNDEIRWRPHAFPEEDDWVKRPSDGYVIRLPYDDRLDAVVLLRALVTLRDWLAGYRSSVSGTTGSCAMSLLRSSLERLLCTGSGTRPPLLQTRGGRQQLGAAGSGEYRGRLEQIDLPSAYASELGGVFYGGTWLTVAEAGRDAGWWADMGQPVFARADVKIPELLYGPLVRRLPGRTHHALMELYAKRVDAQGRSWLYPVGTRLSGVWTWQELEAADQAGCKIRVRDAWVHRSRWRPFWPWWERVQEGRRLPGVAGTLAKMTGNALWGRFAMDPRVAGVRTVKSYSGDRQTARTLRQNPFAWPAHDLAETVSGRVRAKLFLKMMEVGEDVLSAHTDGLWIRSDPSLEHGDQTGDGPDSGSHSVGDGTAEWRPKANANQLQLLNPQCLRYRNRYGWHTVMAGTPPLEADAAFARVWAQAGLG